MPPVTVETLQRVFKTLADPTRVRVLSLLEREELAVSDLVQILGVAQSSVSRHLSILREVGLLHDRREGTYAYYRFVSPTETEWRTAWELAKNALADDPMARADSAALETLLAERVVQTRRWFDSIGADWDHLREVLNDDAHRARALLQLIPSGLRVADIGTGTGVLAQDLASSGATVFAIDNSQRMLSAARRKFEALHLDNVELRYGCACDLPLDDAAVDAAFAHMVLHYLASPSDALAEMARVVRPGGRVVVVDFVANDQEWLRRDLGVLWGGFTEQSLRQWFGDAGLIEFELEVCEAAGRSSDLPATFIAVALRPDNQSE